jgi:hypothetical protein
MLLFTAHNIWGSAANGVLHLSLVLVLLLLLLLLQRRGFVCQHPGAG